VKNQITRLVTSPLRRMHRGDRDRATAGRARRPAGARQHRPSIRRTLSGYWELPPDGHDGRNIPRASLAAGVTQQKLAQMAAHDAKGYRWCANLGLPNLMLLTRPLDIRVSTGLMTIMPEYSAAQNRWIYLSRDKHTPADEYEAGVNGDSIGHWDGDTLVVETKLFDPDKGILGIPGGGFRTPDSKLVERFRLVKNGQVLQVLSTWTDPKVFRTPHTYELRYARLPRDYDARPNAVCDPYDEERAQLFAGPPKQTR
jgi:hypothetical protein